MNSTRIAVMVTPPAGDGWGQVSVGDSQRACWFDPLRFVAPWPVPIAGDRLIVTNNGHALSALWLLGRGTPTGG